MKINSVQKWIVEDFTSEEAKKLRWLGWKWADQGTPPPTSYGHFYTNNGKLVEVTARFIKGSTITELTKPK